MFLPSISRCFIILAIKHTPISMIQQYQYMLSRLSGLSLSFRIQSAPIEALAARLLVPISPLPIKSRRPMCYVDDYISSRFSVPSESGTVQTEIAELCFPIKPNRRLVQTVGAFQHLCQNGDNDPKA